MTTRKDILEQLARGEIDAAQAADLLNGAAPVAQDEPANDIPLPPAEPAAPAEPRVAAKPPVGRRWLRIHVSDLETGRSRVRVNVPLGLVNLGLRVGARFTNEVDSGLMRDVMSALQDSAVIGTLVEVEDVEDNERVHIFVE